MKFHKENLQNMTHYWSPEKVAKMYTRESLLEMYRTLYDAEPEGYMDTIDLARSVHQYFEGAKAS